MVFARHDLGQLSAVARGGGREGSCYAPPPGRSGESLPRIRRNRRHTQRGRTTESASGTLPDSERIEGRMPLRRRGMRMEPGSVRRISRGRTGGACLLRRRLADKQRFEVTARICSAPSGPGPEPPRSTRSTLVPRARRPLLLRSGDRRDADGCRGAPCHFCPSAASSRARGGFVGFIAGAAPRNGPRLVGQ